MLGMSGKGLLLGGAFGKGTSNLAGTNQTALASYLSPPEPPIWAQGINVTTFYGPVLLAPIAIAVLVANGTPQIVIPAVVLVFMAWWYALNFKLPKLKRREFERECHLGKSHEPLESPLLLLSLRRRVPTRTRNS
jgi:hypothetical protein